MSIFDVINALPTVDEVGVPVEEAPAQPAAQEVTPEPSDLSAFDGVPDEWKPKEKFASSEQELEFYRQKYTGLWKHVGSEQFADQLIEKYGEALLNAKESEIEGFGRLLKGMEQDPVGFLTAYLPEYAEQLGIGDYFTDDEIDAEIEREVSEKFGENWRDVFNPADLAKRSSVSSQIHQYQAQLQREYEESNQQVKANRQAYLNKLAEKEQSTPAEGITPQNIDAMVDNVVDQFFDEAQELGLSEDEFVELVMQSMQYTPTLKDVHKMFKHDDLIAKAKEEGRREALAEIKKAGRSAAEQFVPTRNDAPAEEKPRVFMGMRI